MASSTLKLSSAMEKRGVIDPKITRPTEEHMRQSPKTAAATPATRREQQVQKLDDDFMKRASAAAERPSK